MTAHPLASSPKRILFLEGNTDGTVGGSQRVLLEVVSHLDRSKFDPLVLFYEEHKLVSAFRKRCPVIIFNTGSLRLGADLPAAYRALSKVPPLLFVALGVQKVFNLCAHVIPEFFRIVSLMRRERVDLVCLNNAPVLTAWLLGCKILGRPCVSYFRGTPSSMFPLHRRLVGHYDAVLSISQAVTDNARRCGADVSRFELVYDGIDAAAVRERVVRSRNAVLREFVDDPTRPVIGVVNNLKHWKGQHIVVAAMRAVHAARPDVTCLLVGDVAEMDRPYADQLREQVIAAGLERQVIFTGPRMDVPELLGALDVVMHTSLLGEGFPRVILEAMVIGRPLIVSASGPSLEMIEDGVSGWVVAADDPAALASCILRVLDTPDARTAAGARAQARADTMFNIDINMRKTENIFARVLGAER